METRQVFGSREVAWAKRPHIDFCPRCGAKCEPREIHGLPRDVCTSCGKIQWINPMGAVAVVVVEGDRVLLVKRSGGGWLGLWCLPSGAIEYNEDFLTAGLRETEEESGVQVEIRGLLSVHSNFWDHGGSNIAIVLLASPVGGVPRSRKGETDDVAWFPWDALPELAWETDRHIIERYFATRDAGAAVDLDYIRLEKAETRPQPPPVSTHPPPDSPLYHPL